MNRYNDIVNKLKNSHIFSPKMAKKKRKMEYLPSFLIDDEDEGDYIDGIAEGYYLNGKWVSTINENLKNKEENIVPSIKEILIKAKNSDLPVIIKLALNQVEQINEEIEKFKQDSCNEIGQEFNTSCTIKDRTDIKKIENTIESNILEITNLSSSRILRQTKIDPYINIIKGSYAKIKSIIKDITTKYVKKEEKKQPQITQQDTEEDDICGIITNEKQFNERLTPVGMYILNNIPSEEVINAYKQTENIDPSWPIQQIIRPYIDLKSSCDIKTIADRIYLKMKLIALGYFSKEQLKDIVIEQFSSSDIDVLGPEFVADYIQDLINYNINIYTPKQLKKSYEKVATSFVLKNDKFIELLNQIKYDDEIALRIFLWIDTFHDFKGSRLGSAGREFKVNHQDKSFLEVYRDSFFEFNKKREITGYNYLIEYTVLNGVQGNVDHNLLYDIATILIGKKGDLKFEDSLLYAYLLINFDFKLTKLSLLKDLKKVFWSSISSEEIPYYAKDVDKGSGNMLKGKLVVLPASLFDANPSNSSKIPEEFVNIPTTLIPYANGYNFKYSFDKDNCGFTLSYGENPVMNMNKFKKTCNQQRSQDDYKEENDDEDEENDDEKGGKKVNAEDYFDENGIINIPPNTKGMSPHSIVSIITQLYDQDNIKDDDCHIMDFWVSLKRIGDYGQILQCKQLGIPLFTTDNMQLLLSIQSRSSVVWSPDNTKVLWYDGVEDKIKCNGLDPESNKFSCSIPRLISNDYDIIVNEGLKIIRDDAILESVTSKDDLILSNLPSIPTDIRGEDTKMKD